MNKREESFLLNLLQSVKDDNYEFLSYAPNAQKDSLGNQLFTLEQINNFGLYLQSLYLEKYVSKFNNIHNFENLTGNYYFKLTPKAIVYFEEKRLDNTKNTKLTLYDVFLSHANADKIDFVDELYLSLENLGINIFYDKKILSWGDKWKDKILEGTRKSEFAIIVISENFFDREWTEKELSEFLKRQNASGQKTILPLLYKITIDELVERYPSLADIQAIVVDDISTDKITILFARELIKRLKRG